MREASVRRTAADAGLVRVGMLAGQPVLLLAAFGTGGQTGLVAAALTLTAAGLIALVPLLIGRTKGGTDGETGLPDREAAIACLEDLDRRGAIAGRQTAALAVGVERMDDFRRRLGEAAVSALLTEAAGRIGRVLRGDDLVVRLDDAAFGIVLSNLKRADLEMLVRIGGRVQRELSEPFHLGGIKVYATVSVGLCLPNRAPARDGPALLVGAERALAEARAQTGGAIRTYSPELRDRDRRASALAESAGEALARGEIRPWFQPQVCTDTGRVTGLEALARWERQDGGVLTPGDFLPALEAAGLTGRLGETVLTHALAALADWDRAELGVPEVSVNVSPHGLSNPRYVDRVRWELDRFDMDPRRLRLELRETLTGDGPEDMGLRNLRALSDLGCRIDLDDFGAGAVPLCDLARFSVSRIKIDRSLVARVDRDTDQQRMVAAVIDLAERLGIGTLAVGAETLGEIAMLAQIGCRHVQGLAVAAPMPAGEVPGWLARRGARASAREMPGAEPCRDGKTA